MLQTPRRRTGFTLIELLVVISLISLIMALSAGAFFRVKASQSIKATEATLVKLDTALDSRRKAILSQVQEDAKSGHPGYKAALTLAGTGGDDVAKAIWTYAKMKNELPMSVAEAVTPVTVGSYNLPAKGYFMSATIGFGGISGTGTQDESAACFYLALTNNAADGVLMDTNGLTQQAGDVLVGGKAFRCVKDDWGTPIAFVRQCYTPELNAPPYIRAGQPQDPFFPLPGRNLGSVYAGMSGYWGTLINNVPGFAAMPGSYPGPRNFIGALISAGANRSFDGNPFGTSSSDDIVSFRLRREGQRGD